MMPLPSGHDNVAHTHVVQTFHPDAYDAAAALVEPMDYLTARLTGRVTATQSTVFGQVVCDNRVWGTTEYDPELVAATRLDPTSCPAGADEQHRRRGAAAVAAELGIAAGTPVAPAPSTPSHRRWGAARSADAGAVIIGTTSVLVSHITNNATTSALGSWPCRARCRGCTT